MQVDPKSVIRFALPGEVMPGVGAEVLSADLTSDGFFRLDTVPLFVDGVSHNDVVSARSTADGTLDFASVVRRGGHSTCRVLLPKPLQTLEDVQRQLGEVLQPGCIFRGAYGQLLTIDVPPEVDARRMLLRLMEGGRAGRWQFLWAHDGHGLGFVGDGTDLGPVH
jgi:hypothetical protein